MKKLTIAAALATATMLSSPALAADAGTVQVKLMATGVLPDGKIDKVNINAVGLPATTQTTANDNVVPTLAIDYYVSPAISVETICCFTQHHVTGAGPIAGADVAQHVLILPATVTLKYHLDAGPIKPYVGVGPSVFFYFDEKPGATAIALGASKLKMDNKFGVAVQAGFDIPVNDTGMGISLDAKKYFMKTTTHFYTAAGVEALSTDHKLDPWVISGGVYFSF
ncbi:MAG: OmpW family protein [Novosphingobium sp.]|uniref:OmpW/AlkL family protein n=1 Tax=Novosphingobium sp. TaxID=1874826 RepID=UPI001DC46379|nr:OmpW family outer membrane protein [Novosphingobium sp.]MCB2058324.1 OmpW family protein [Novosphingobium sp.]MCP5385613.1 OmpW family protein [Novosphingobium sp.]